MGFGGGGRVFPICDLSRQAPTGMFHVVFVQFINHDDTLPAQSCTRCYYIQWRIIKIESINFSLPTCLDYLSTVWIGWEKKNEGKKKRILRFNFTWAIWLCKCCLTVSSAFIVEYTTKKTIVRTSTLHKVHAGFLRFDEGRTREKDKMINKQRKNQHKKKWACTECRGRLLIHFHYSTTKRNAGVFIFKMFLNLKTNFLVNENNNKSNKN